MPSNTNSLAAKSDSTLAPSSLTERLSKAERYQESPPRRRYETLDALRGIAALAVVGFHSTASLFPRGYLAVDFFFILSGFVVALAYEGLLQHRLSWGGFFLKRVIRLYPLAFAGALIGFLVLLLKWHSFPGKVDPLPQILVSGILNGVMLPTLFGGAVSRHELFPGNGPLWSLFFELVINLLWARFGVFAKTRTLAAFTLLSGLCLIVMAVHLHTANLGFHVETIGGGMVRVCFGFPLGVVLYRFHAKGWGWSTRFSWGASWPFLGLILLAVLAFPRNVGAGGVPWFDLIAILMIMPTIVALGVLQKNDAGRIGRFLGELSYPVYVLHYPILLIASGLQQTKLSKVNTNLTSACAVALVLALATIASRFYDEPVRRWLSQAVKKKSGSIYAPSTQPST
jgi:peptidoglycan/LPS O-acetylase OafA/YrhL